MKFIRSLLFLLLTTTVLHAKNSDPGYSVPEALWPESFGNHRAVLEISKESEVVILDLLWRRHDPRPDNKRFIIVEATTGDYCSQHFPLFCK